MAPDEQRLRVAVLGAGLIGIDLADKIRRSAALELALVAGRDRDSLGLRRAADMGHPTTAGGIRAVVEAGPFDVVFDASNADSHAEHWAALRPSGTTLIDLTPADLGTVIVPGVTSHGSAGHRHLNLVSCGGQAAIPILHAISQRCAPTYIEVVSTGASASAGRATRLNLDQYIATTSAAIRTFTGTREAKVMVNLSPARPAPPFRVAMTVLADGIRPAPVRTSIAAAAHSVRAYTPGFKVTSLAVDPGRVSVAVEVTACGGRLPRHAGSVDIINAAAVLLAEQTAAGSR
ncbi:acetaldehyde dehydrogenase (acetylating) [Streptomyces sp. ME02-6987-2C]|uniref:acetylating acetaldehyde dehydrogenase n=1 Tax=unclassified Streptomyces TaxID=2593676 RepID=UPI0029B3A6F3|nr:MULTISPECIES: acetaldehyde dehydrogenase (acetylating) [unclassified Streptomyces]MDX3367592.1 acetaldehyde dehydrogenase (acetylating) [Streptomyces sp. ME02-6987-2C]MDX3425797.1 acetaldehyde dehydrogenase (acetylating) [Streptomyces sp. ME02-6985-2c]